VHAFTNDPERGKFVLIFLGVVVGSSLLLFALRAHKLKGTAEYELISRDSALLANNVLLAVTCGMVLTATLYPLLLDALGMGKISVGAQYFSFMFVLLMWPILLIVGIGSMLNWKRDNLAGRRNTFIFLAIASVVLAIVFATQLYGFKITAVAALAAAVWIVATSIYSLIYRLRNKRNRLHAVMHTPAAFWGMTIAHIGIAVFTVGVALTSIYAEEATVRMAPGDTHELSEYTIGFVGAKEVRGENYLAMQGEFQVSRDDQSISTIVSEKRVYDVRRDLMTEAGIDAGVTRDIFIALGESLGDDGAWAVRLQLKPYIRWIWIGTLIMAIGGLLAAIDGRYRVKKRKAVQSKEALTPTATAAANS